MRKKTKRILAFFISVVLLIEAAMPNSVLNNRVKAENNTAYTQAATTTEQNDGSSETTEDSKANVDITDGMNEEVTDTSETVTEAISDSVDNAKQRVQNKAGQNQGYQSASGVEIPLGNPEEIDCHTPVEGEELPDNVVFPKSEEGFSLKEDKVVTGDLYLKDTTVELNGYTLLIKGNLYQENSDIQLQGGSLIVEGDYRMSRPCLDDEDKVSYEPIDNGLIGSDAGEIIKVYGGFYVNCEARIGSLYGTMLVGGDFKVQNGDYDSNSFITKQEESRIILDGSKEQYVELSTGKKDNSVFLYRVELQNSSEEGVHFEGCIYIYEEFISNDSIYDGTIGIGGQTKLEEKKLTADIIILENRELTENLQTEEDLYVNYMLNLKQYSIACKNLYINHYLNMNKGSANVGKNLICNGSNVYAGLSLAEEENKVTVGGNLLLKGSSNLLLQKGTLTLMGDLLSTTDGEIVANNAAQLIFSGDEQQDIKVEGGKARIACLTVRNSSEEGVVLHSPIILNRVIYDQGQFSYAGNSCYGMRLQKDTELDRLELYGGTLDLNGHTLTVHEDVVNHYGSIVLNGGTLLVEGNYTHCKESGCVYEGEACKEAALFMEQENDVLQVKGNLKLSDSLKESRITAGRIEVGGNLSLGTKAVLAGTSKLVLNGDKEQLVQGYNKVNQVVIDNPVKVSYEYNLYITGSYQDEYHTTNSNGYIMYTEQLDNIVRNVWQGECYLRGANTLEEDVTLPALKLEGELELAGHTLTIEQDFDMNGLLKMQKDTDYLLVKGDYRMNSSYPQEDAVTKGKTEILGNLVQAFGHAYETSGTHVTRLSKPAFIDGEMVKQMVTISGNEGPCVAVMELTKNVEFYSFSNELEALAKKVTYDLVDKEPPTAPGKLTVTEITDTKVSLSWDASLDDVAVTGYYVYVNGEKEAVTTDTKAVLNHLTPSTAYHIYVIARDGERRESMPSNTVAITTKEDETAPERVQNLRIKDKTASRVVLSWDASVDNVAIQGYHIYRDGKLLSTVAGDELQYEDTQVVKGQNYEYQVEAFDEHNNIGEQSIVLEVTMRELSITQMLPEAYSSIGGESANLNLKWSDLLSSSGYQVELLYSVDSQDWHSITSQHCKNSELEYTWDYKALEEGEVSVKAVVSDVDGNQANKVVAYKIDRTAPVLPELTAIHSENAKVILEWLPTTDEDFKEYRLYRRMSPEENYVLLNRITDIGKTKYEDSSVIVGSEYSYYVVAVDTIGNSSKPLDLGSAVVEQDTEKPEVTSITPNSGTYGLNLNISMAATDNVGIDYFVIEYKQQNEEAWKSFGEIKAAGNKAQQKWDEKEGSDWYQVRGYAVDYAGNHSDYSAIKSYYIDNTGIEKVEITEVIPKSSYIGLKWKDVIASDFSYFSVEQLIDGSYREVATSKNTLGAYIYNLSAGTQYQFRVLAYDLVGNRGEESEVVTVTTLEDSVAPVIKAISIDKMGSKTIHIDVEADDDIKVSRVEFAYSGENDTYHSFANVTSPKEKSFSTNWDCSQLKEGAYKIGIRVYDSSGNCSNNGEYTVNQVYVDHTAPEQVKNLKIEDKNGCNMLSFDAVSAEDCSGYYIYRRSETQEEFELYDSCKKTQYTDTKAVPDVVYEYKVAAVDTAKNIGLASDIVICKTAEDREEPKAYILNPTSNSVITQGAVIYVRATDNIIVKAVSVYYRKAGEAAWVKLGSTAVPDDSGIAKLAFRESELLQHGEAYEIMAQAEDGNGNIGSSETILVTMDKEAPAIQNVKAVAGNSKITLSWDQNKEEDFAGYQIWRRTSVENAYTYVSAGLECNYTDTVINAEIGYQYEIRAYDVAGNYSYSRTAEVFPYNVDDVAPVAKITGDYNVALGSYISLSAANSSDNIGIVDYQWDMGDGQKKSGANIAYAYSETGEYEVTLKVTDHGGMTDTVTKTIVVEDDTCEQYQIIVVDEKQQPIPNATIILSSDIEKQMVTNSEGYASCAVKPGEYKAYVAADNYEPKEITIHVKQNTTRMQGARKAAARSGQLESGIDNCDIVVMEENEFLTGTMKIRKLDLEEIKEAGIDITDPSNLFVTEIEFDIIATVTKEKSSGKTNCVLQSSGGGAYWGTGDYESNGKKVNYVVNYEEISDSVTMADYGNTQVYTFTQQGKVSWLKDFFQVDTSITNMAATGMDITRVNMNLELPSGLSMITTVQGFSTILAAGETLSNSWILRGDEGGTYTIKGKFSGYMENLNKAISLELYGEVEVRGEMSSGLRLYLYPEKSMHEGTKYYIQYKLVNEGSDPLYNVSTTLGEYENPGNTIYVTEITDSGNYQYEVKSAGNYYIKKGNEVPQSLITSNGDTVTIEQINPGQAYFGTHVIDGNTVTTDNIQLYLNKGLGGENGDGTVVEYIDSHVKGEETIDNRTPPASPDSPPSGSESNDRSIPPVPKPVPSTLATTSSNSSTEGDPISVESGAYQDSQTILQCNGGEELLLTMSYDSRYTDGSGELGKGWTHNYEQKLVNENGSIRYYMDNNKSLNFVSDAVLEGNLIGTYDEETGVITLSDLAGEEITYSCTNAGMDRWKLTRKTDGTYLLEDGNGNQENFDEEGQLIRISYKDGNSVLLTHKEGETSLSSPYSKNRITMKRDQEGRISSVTDDSGRSETFTYDENGCMASRTNPAGITYRYTYNEQGKLLTATDGDGITYITNTYDEQGRVLTQKDGTGTAEAISLKYDDREEEQKTLVTIKNRLGQERTVLVNADLQAELYIDALGRQKSYSYDGEGNITAIRYEDGTEETREYNSTNHITRLVTREGITYTYTYDENQNLTSMSGSNGDKASYTYDGRNRCISSTDAKGITTTYTYNEAGQVLTSKTEGRGTTANEYDEAYRLVKITQPNGLAGEYTYDRYGYPSGYKDSEGRQITFTFDEVGHLLRQKVKTGEEEWSEISATYNSYGAATSVTDANGNKTGYEYDANTLLIKETYADGTTKQYIRDAEGNIVKIIYPQKEGDKAVTEEALYDAAGNLKELTSTLGGITAYSYQSTLLTTVISPEGGEASLEYDKNGRLTALTDKEGRKTSLTYDAAGRITTATDAAGSQESYTYDQYGQLIKTTNAEGESSQLTYDSYGNVTRVTDARGNSTTYEYDGEGNRIRETAPEGQVTTYTYDKYNRITSVTKEAKDKENSQQICYTYKDLLLLPSATQTNGQEENTGIIESITDAEGSTYKIGYDKAGNITDLYDAYGNNIQHTEYDCMNQTVRVTDGNGSVTSYAYDGMGNITAQIQQLNEDTTATTTYQYIGGTLLSSVMDAQGGQSSYTYDREGNLTSIENPNGGITSFTYDSSGNVTSETVKGGSTHSYTYTANNLLEEKENSKGQKTAYTYDKAGRITRLTDEEGTITYTYDENGNVLTVTEEKEDGSRDTIKRTYDKANRVTSCTDAAGNQISYDYNELGQLTTVTYPDGRKVTYTYDRNNNLTSVTDWEGRITNYTYNKNGQLSKLERADKTVENYEYDKAGQLISQKDVDAEGKVIHSYDYTYNLAGNITKIEKEGVKESTADSSTSANKASVVSGEASEEEDTTVTMEYSDDNRLISYNGEKVTYDEEGNMTYGPLDGKMTEFIYDCRNRLIKAGDTEYGYDAENNRTAVTKDGVTTKYVVDSNCEYSQVLTATTGDDVIYYIYGDGLIAQEDEQDYLTYHYNQVGSTTALTDEQGVVIETYEYSPYGDILDGDSSLTMFLYNGKYGVASDDNGLYYMRARYYDISIKRFVNQDVVIGHLDTTSSLNRYAYCEGNPVSYLDPFGLDREDVSDIHRLIALLDAALKIGGTLAIVVSGGSLAPLFVSIWKCTDMLLTCIDASVYIDEIIRGKREGNDMLVKNASIGLVNVLLDVVIGEWDGLTYTIDNGENAAKTILKISDKEIDDNPVIKTLDIVIKKLESIIRNGLSDAISKF